MTRDSRDRDARDRQGQDGGHRDRGLLTNLTDPRASEELVAYLDGELDTAAAAVVEERLKRDAEYRRQFHELKQAWELLDALPTGESNSLSARTTIEMVALSAERDVRREKITRQATLWAAAGVLFAVAAILAHGAVGHWTGDPQRRLIENLPVIERLDYYWHAESIEFLASLADAGHFSEAEGADRVTDADVPRWPSESRPESPLESSPPESSWSDHSSMSLAERTERVRELTGAEKAELARRRSRFEALEPASQRRLGELERQLSSDPRGSELRTVMMRYGDWLKTLPATDRYLLLALPIPQRVERIGELIERQRPLLARVSRQDLEAMHAWLRDLVERRKDDLKKRPRAWQNYENAPRFAKPYMLMRAIAQFPEMIREDDIRRLEERISPNARQILAETPGGKQEMVRSWLRQLAAKRLDAFEHQVSNEELRKFHQSLEPGLQRELRESFGQDVTAFRRELIERYFRQDRGSTGSVMPRKAPNLRPRAVEPAGK